MSRAMTPKNYDLIFKAFTKFAKRLENEYGIKADFSNFKNDGQVMTFSAIVGFAANGELETRETQFAKQMMPSVGFKPEIVGHTFNTSRGAIAITGYRTNASRNVINITVNGRPGYCAPGFISSVCAIDPSFSKFVIKDFDKSSLPQKRRRRQFAF